MDQRVDPTSENTAFTLSVGYGAEVRASSAREPCPLPLEVDICVLEAREVRGEAMRIGSNVAVEWPVFVWYPGHVMNDAGCRHYHDGRCIWAQRLLLDYVLLEGRGDFVSRMTDFLWTAIFHSARARVHGRPERVANLNVRCKHGRHRSLGWACLAAQVFLLLGVRVKFFIPQSRLCRCRFCNYPIDPRQLRGIWSVCDEIECNIAERNKGVNGTTIRDTIVDYIEWLDYLPFSSLFDGLQ
jgi:hypothetical protein